VINGRLVRNAAANFGDYKNTADRPAEFYPVTGDWEAIPTTNESYGYHQFDSSHKPASSFIQLIAKAASRGGNLLMNIGPKGDGAFDTKDLRILDSIGKWMDENGESIYGTHSSLLPLQSWGVSTQKGNKVYLHVFDWPADGKLYVGGFTSYAVEKAYLQTAASNILPVVNLNTTDCFIKVPASAPDIINTVIVLEVKPKSKTNVTAYLSDSIRFKSPNIKDERFLAFDAELRGKGLSYGDGKADRYYVENWQILKGQSLVWKFRTLESAAYKIIVKYIVPENGGGSFALSVSDGFGSGADIEDSKGKVVTREIGVASLMAGDHEITISPSKIKPGGLMRLLEMRLVRLEKK
jgi:hypothetical protein